MGPRDFLARVPGAIRPLVPTDLADFHSGSRFSLAQLWYGNRALHYEVWLRHRQGVVEIGLHFESDPLTNLRLLAAFRARERTLRSRLGEAARIEEWDRGWSRVWEPCALDSLDEALLERLATRLARYVAVCEPVLRVELPADVPWKLRPPRAPSRTPRGKRRSSASTTRRPARTRASTRPRGRP
jgi:hypothetical protein